MEIELSVGHDELFAGDWTFRTTCDREPVSVVGEWEQFCWQSDKKCDYLELGIELSHGLRLERQLLLARDDRVLFLADTCDFGQGISFGQRIAASDYACDGSADASLGRMAAGKRNS